MGHHSAASFGCECRVSIGVRLLGRPASSPFLSNLKDYSPNNNRKKVEMCGSFGIMESESARKLDGLFVY